MDIKSKSIEEIIEEFAELIREYTSNELSHLKNSAYDSPSHYREEHTRIEDEKNYRFALLTELKARLDRS